MTHEALSAGIVPTRIAALLMDASITEEIGSPAGTSNWLGSARVRAVVARAESSIKSRCDRRAWIASRSSRGCGGGPPGREQKDRAEDHPHRERDDHPTNQTVGFTRRGGHFRSSLVSAPIERSTTSRELGRHPLLVSRGASTGVDTAKPNHGDVRPCCKQVRASFPSRASSIRFPNGSRQVNRGRPTMGVASRMETPAASSRERTPCRSSTARQKCGRSRRRLVDEHEVKLAFSAGAIPNEPARVEGRQHVFLLQTEQASVERARRRRTGARDGDRDMLEPHAIKAR